MVSASKVIMVLLSVFAAAPSLPTPSTAPTGNFSPTELPSGAKMRSRLGNSRRRAEPYGRRQSTPEWTVPPAPQSLRSGSLRSQRLPSSSGRRKSGVEQASRSRNGQYEHLCDLETSTVHLNTRHLEYNPPFYVEVRCKRPQSQNGLPMARVQKCAFDFLHCVQTYRTYHFSRRRAGTDCWQPYTIEVPSGCECMWPTEELGPVRQTHEDL